MGKKKFLNKKWKKVVFIISLIIVIFVVVVVIFISPITKYVIEKYDTKYLGREITLDWAYVNPFTGYVHLDDLKIYEQKNDSVFFSVSGISVNVSMFKLLSKTYEISSLTLNKPKGIIIKNDSIFNFSDIIDKFAEMPPRESKEPVHFNILDVSIKNGEFTYKEPNTPLDFSFVEINFNSSGKRWDNDTITGKLSLTSGFSSGQLKAKFLVNLESSDYDVTASLKEFDLDVINQYLKDLSNYGNVSGYVNLDVKAKGNFNNPQDLYGNGFVMLDDVHFGKDPSNDYVSFDKLTVAFKQIAPAKKKFFIDSIRLDHPIFKYEKYDYLDNIQYMFGVDGAKIKEVKADPEKFNLIVSAAEYIKKLFKDFFKSDYKLNSLAIVNADIKYNDFSTNSKFTASLNPLNIKAKDLDNNKQKLNIYINSGLKPYGNLAVTFTYDPRTNNDFNINYALNNVPVAMFNPYVITYTSFPLDRGKIELNGYWNIHNSLIDSRNHLIIIDPRTSKRIRRRDTKWIPVPLIMSIIRERGNVIDYEIPIKGDLKDPKFNFVDPIVDAVKNIFVKPPTTPYRFKVKNAEKEIEKSLAITWRMRQNKLIDNQETFMHKISKFLKENPIAKIEVRPMTYTEREKEDILFFEAKKKFYFSYNKGDAKDLNYLDSIAIDKMSIKDSSFITYLDNKVKGTLLFTIQEKCYYFLGEKMVNDKFDQLLKTRNEVFMNFFKKDGTDKQIKMLKNRDVIPFNGFSYFDINYEGDVPEELVEAFQKLREYDDNSPRDRYKKFRKNHK